MSTNRVYSGYPERKIHLLRPKICCSFEKLSAEKKRFTAKFSKKQQILVLTGAELSLERRLGSEVHALFCVASFCTNSTRNFSGRICAKSGNNLFEAVFVQILLENCWQNLVEFVQNLATTFLCGQFLYKFY